MGAAVAITPTSVCYQVASDFRNYKSGVYTSKICKNGQKDVNHAVLAVGYDKDQASGLPYYWSRTLGELLLELKVILKLFVVKICAALLPVPVIPSYKQYSNNILHCCFIYSVSVHYLV